MAKTKVVSEVIGEYWYLRIGQWKFLFKVRGVAGTEKEK